RRAVCGSAWKSARTSIRAPTERAPGAAYCRCRSPRALSTPICASASVRRSGRPLRRYAERARDESCASGRRRNACRVRRAPAGPACGTDRTMPTQQEEIFERIRATLVELFELDPGAITPEARLAEDLEIDSIDVVDLMDELRRYTG